MPSVHPPRILVVDEEPLLRTSLRACLEQHGFSDVVAADAAHALERCSAGVDLFLIDSHLPNEGGLPMIRRLRETAPAAAVILMTAHAAPEDEMIFKELGATDQLTKPFTPEQVFDVVHRVLDTRTAAASPEPRGAPPRRPYAFDCIIGQSAQIRHTKALLERIAASPGTTVLLTGESGTGKDLASRTIHFNSARASQQFVNITCSALPETLLESELFGHERGAFTDAKAQKRGLLEIADKGSVFLDEIGELSPTLQAKLLRFLEERAFRRVGGSVDIRVDVRIIAATNRDLRAEVEAGRFREDLYYRLSVLPIRLPALRERAEDIPALVHHYIGLLNQELRRQVVGITAEADRRLRAYAWPGNVRELRNVVERAMLLTDAAWLDVSDFPSLEASAATAPVASFRLPPNGVDLEEVERDLLVQALERTHWNKTRAARLLGLNRDQIRYRIAKFSLSGEKGSGHQPS